MKFKIEFPENKSKAFPAAVRACRTFPTYKVSESFHSIEFSEAEYKSGHAVFDIVRGFVGALFYKDGLLIRENDMNGELYQLRARNKNQDRKVDREILLKGAMEKFARDRVKHLGDVEEN